MSKRKKNPSRDRLSSRLQQTISGLVLASALAVSLSAIAEGKTDTTAKGHYHISSGSLSHALTQFAGSAGILLSTDARLTDGKTSAGLDGEYTVEEGFRKLLAGSGLTYTLTGNNSVAIKVIDSKSDAVLNLPAVKVTGKAVSDPNDPYNPDYSLPNASTATKTDTPIMNTPVNIQVVSKALMNDQQDTNIVEALTKNVSGVQAEHGSGNIYENFIIRGFSADSNVYRNGLRRGMNNFDPANIDQLEVLKGPAAMLYGRGQPGGMVNYVTKKGLNKPYYSLQQQFGTYDQYRTTVDATGPLDEAGTLSYRFNGSYQDMGSFKDFINDQRVFIAPTLSYKPNDRFEANFELEYKHEKKVDDWGIPAIGNRPAPIPLNTFLGDAALGPKTDTIMTAFDWAFNINSNWKIKNRFLWEQWDMNYFDIATGKLRPNNQLQNRFLISGPANQETFATNIDLLGNFELLGMKHDVLIGGDFFHNGFNGFNENYTFGVLPPVDIFNPIHGVIDIASLSQLPRDWNFMRKEEWFGIYFQDQITLWDKLHILGGGRYDWANDGSSYSDVSPDAAMANFKSVQNQKFSPRVGVVYQPQDWLSLYGNYTESLGSNNGLNNTGSVLAPEIGEQFEGGIKTEFFDKRLSSTIAYYHLVKNNIVTTDVNGFSVPIGGARSRGIEADIKGRITDQINLVATYAFTDARVIKNNDGILGKRLANVPEHQASLWGTYNFTDHFKMGLGGVAVGRKSGDPGYNPDVELPGYVTMDAMVSYALPVNKSRLTTQLNFYNLLDKDYYAGAYNRYHITTGTPLSVMGSLRYEF